MQTAQQQILAQAYGDFNQLLLKRSHFKVRDDALAEDLVQITFQKAWVYFVKFGKIESMKAFLFHILNNLIIDQYRKKKAVSLDSMVDLGFQVSADDSDRLFNSIDGKKATLLIPQ